MSDEKKESIKKKFGEAIGIIPGKSEHWLMVGFEDGYDLYFQGNKNDESALVEVMIFGSASADAYEKLTSTISGILNDELNIPKNRIYIKYEECKYWGWNGSNL